MKLQRKTFKYACLTAGVLMMTPMSVQAATGWQQDSSQNWTYVENDKKLTNQWVPWSDGSMRFVGGNGQIVTDNWVNYKGEKYRVKADGTRYENEWFSMNNKASSPSGKPSTSWYYAGEDGVIYTDGWYEIDGSTYYFYGGGNSPRGTFFNLEDKRYYADENGARKNPGWFSISGTNSNGQDYTNWYYVQEDGSLLKDGWYEVDGKTRYFDANGLNYRKRWFTQEDYRFYVDEEGARQSGWFSISGVNSSGTPYTNWYYADTNDGSVWKGGWATLDGDWYYFDPNGLNYRKRWYQNNRGQRFYLQENGVLQDDGWFKIENVNSSTGVVTENWYYAQESGAVLKSGFYDLDDVTYYFDGNGLNYREKWANYDGGRRYLDENGAAHFGEWFVIIRKDSRDREYHDWYYAGDDGKVLKSGWHEVDGKKYYFESSGLMRTGWFEDSSEDYYCDEENGDMAVGWKWIEIPEDWAEDDQDVLDYVNEHGNYAWFFFNRKNGENKRSSSGKKEMKIEGTPYCIDDDGVMHYGWVKLSTTTPAISGYRYFYDPESGNDDSLVMGEKVEGKWMYIEGPQDFSTGEKNWYYFDKNGKPFCAGENQYQLKKISGDWYVFDMYGAAQYGLVEVDGEFYYCGEPEDDRSCRTGKILLDDGTESGKSTYYFDSDGKGVTGIQNGYFYYKGKLQKASSSSKYEMFEVPGLGKRLINTSGKMITNKKVEDGDDREWEVGGRGVIQVYGSDEITEIIPPEATTTY